MRLCPACNHAMEASWERCPRCATLIDTATGLVRPAVPSGARTGWEALLERPAPHARGHAYPPRPPDSRADRVLVTARYPCPSSAARSVGAAPHEVRAQQRRARRLAAALTPPGGQPWPRRPRQLPVAPPQRAVSPIPARRPTTTLPWRGVTPAPDIAAEHGSPCRSCRELGVQGYTRMPEPVVLSMTSPHNLYADVSGDVATGGLFVATHVPAARGDWVEVNLWLPDLGGPLTTCGQVHWVRRFDPDAIEGLPGFGLSMSLRSPRLVEAIRRFARCREPILYEE